MSEQKKITQWLTGLSILLILTSTMFIFGAVIGSPLLFGVGLPAACLTGPFWTACAMDWHQEYRDNNPKISYARMAKELGAEPFPITRDRWWLNASRLTNAVGPHGLKKAYKLHQKGLKKAEDKLAIEKTPRKEEPKPDYFEFLQPTDRAWYDGQMAFVREVGEEAKKDLPEIMSELEEKIKHDIAEEERKAKEEERKAFLKANPDLARQINDIKDELRDLTKQEVQARKQSSYYESEYQSSLRRDYWSHHISDEYYKTYRRYQKEASELKGQIHELTAQRDELEDQLEARICK